MGAGEASEVLLLEEACALALEGRFDEALVLLDEGSKSLLEGRACSSPDPSPVAAGRLDLIKARILIARGEPADFAGARNLLESLRDRIKSLSGDVECLPDRLESLPERASVLRDRGPSVRNPEQGRDDTPELPRTTDAETWRVDLALARLELRQERLTHAAAFLKDALEGFRRRGEILGGAAAALARMLLNEADAIGRPQPGCGAAPENGRASTTHSFHASAARDVERERRDVSGADGPPRTQGHAPDAASLLRLIELGKKLSEETDPDQVLRIVLHEAIELSGLDRGFVVLVSGTALDFALAENLDWSEVEEPTFEVSNTLVRQAIEDAQPIFLRMAETEEGHEAARSLSEIGAHSVACVPLVRPDATLGVLYLDGRDPGHVFTGPKERLIELFASQAAAALENARVHRVKSEALAAAEATIRRQRGEDDRREHYFELIGSSDPMQDLYRTLDLIVPTEEAVLLRGETGTGKELVARIIQRGGPRGGRTFVAANCASMADSLLEAELFGHERGAFTGADRSRAGLFEQADGGTLFLDEIGDTSPRMQADLLRALESGEVRRVGGVETKRVDVRVIAATNRDLEQMISRGGFRQDLYFRLNVLSVHLPALRDRSADIPPLIRAMLARLTPHGQRPPEISEQALRKLIAYPWPGNVRELENIARRLRVQGIETIEPEHLPTEIQRLRAPSIPAGSLRSLEADAIRRAIEAARGSRTEAARLLGIDRKTLYLKLKRLDPEL